MGEALRIAPVSLDDLFAGLPAEERARLAWLPAAVREKILTPLRETPLDQLPGVEPWLLQSTHELMQPFVAATTQLFLNPAGADAIAEGWTRPLPMEDLDVDPLAAADLVAAMRWQGVLSEAVARAIAADAALLGKESESELAAAFEEAADDPEMSVMLRSWMYLLAGIEELFDPQVPSEKLRFWSRRALLESQAAANIMRAHGFPVPTSLPGEGEIPAGVLRFLQRSLDLRELWLFGSRARGVHGPESDWDLLAIVPDGQEPSEDDEIFRLLRRRRVDLFVQSLSGFTEAREVPGSLAHIVVHQGTRVLP